MCRHLRRGCAWPSGVQWPCGRDIAEQWWFDPIDASISAHIISDASVNANAWDVAGGTSVTWDGAGIDAYDYLGSTNEQWRAVPLPNGSFNFVSVSSGKCLDVPSSSKQQGIGLDQYDCNGTNAQAFWVNAYY
jgi:glucosylceramidase